MHFVQNVGKLVLGSGLGQLVSFAAAPFIARLYGPESFGEQSALLSVVAPMAALTSMAFPIAIVIAQADDEALALSRLAFWGSLVLSSIATLLLLVEDMWLLRWLGLAEIGAYTALIPVLVVLTTANMSAGYMMTRYGAFGLSAWASVATAAVGNLSKLAFGVASPNTLSLIAGNALGYLVGPVMAHRLCRRTSAKALRVLMAELKATAHRHWDFPLLRAPQNFIAALSQAMPVIGLTAGFGPKAAGHYAMALAITGAPITLIGNAVQSVLYPRLTAAAQAREDTSRLLILSTLGLVALGAPFFLLITFFGAPLFEALLGPGWREAGVYSALLVPFLWLGLANRPAVSLIPALGLQNGLLIYEIIGTAAKAAAIYFGLFVLDNARWTVGSFSVISALAYLLLIIWVVWKNWKGVRERDHEKTG
jgi:O-antigen/teichoic acid export membrane protein